MRVLFGFLGVFSVCGLIACSTKKVIEVDPYSAGFMDSSFPDSQRADQIPQELTAGTADVFEVVEWSKGLIDRNWTSGRAYPWPLTPVVSFSDLNMDGLSEILVEIPWESGATGNKGAAFFLAAKEGYKYVGTIARLANNDCYAEQRTCYLMTFANSGQDLGIELLEIRSGSLHSLASCRTNKFDTDLNSVILTFPERHEDLFRNFGLGPDGEATALPGCAAALEGVGNAT
ncbi:MAG: hypothetical protein AAF680_00150 [Pseudomonadota bacterium]